MLGGIGKNKAEFKKKLQEAQEEKRINDLIEQRAKSSNERDLETRIEKKRQERIKMELDKLRKADSKEMWKSKNSLIGGKMTILKDDRPILKEKNIFMDNKKIPFMAGDRRMFFKY